MWRLFRRRKRDGEPTHTVAGYSFPPSPEERLDMSMMAVELGKMALAMTEGGTPAQRRKVQKMLDEADATIQKLLANGVKAPQHSSLRADKIASHISKTVNMRS
jgi:hypothetical protein